MKEEQGLLFAPSEMGGGGGLWGDVDATITGAIFIMSNFGGKADQMVPVFELKVEDANGQEYEQLLSIGRGKIALSKDGTKLIPTAEGVKINPGSNFGLFISSLVNGGFPEDKLRVDDISVLLGTKAHFERTAAPKRPGIIKAPRADGKVYEDTILIVTRVLTLPWEAKKGVGKAPAKAPGKAAAPAAKSKALQATDDVGEEAQGAVIQALAMESDVTMQKLAANVFKVAAASPNKAAIVKMIYQEGFLDSIEGVTVENGVVSM